MARQWSPFIQDWQPKRKIVIHCFFKKSENKWPDSSILKKESIRPFSFVSCWQESCNVWKSNSHFMKKARNKRNVLYVFDQWSLETSPIKSFRWKPLPFKLTFYERTDVFQFLGFSTNSGLSWKMRWQMYGRFR